jgi:20S proteasome alpha/beta subunit
MTSIVGVLCKDGAVIGTDSSATYGVGEARIMEQPTEKLHLLNDTVIIAGTGEIGLCQRFCAVVQKAIADNEVRSKSGGEIAKTFTKKALEDLAETYAKLGKFGALVAYPSGVKPYLCQFSLADFQPELMDERLWYGSMGSAQHITDPFLALIRSIFWTDGLPSVHEAIFAVTWALDHAVEINPGGVNGPVRIAVLEKNKKGNLQARKLDDDELGEHREYISEAKNLLRGMREKLSLASTAASRDIPRPQST